MSIFIYFIEKFKFELSNAISIIYYRKLFTSSKLSLSVKLHDVKLSEYNVLFENVVLIKSSLGCHTYIQTGSRIINTTIGKFCSIAPNVTIGPGIHKINSVSTHPSFFLKHTPLIKTFVDKDLFESTRKTTIGHDVWIGEKVVILDGVNIGTGAIVAAGAIVTKDVSPYAVVGGVPAKHIKYRFESEAIDLLLKSEWWNYSEVWLKENSELMLNIEDFIKFLKNDK